MIKALLETLRADAYLTVNKNLIRNIGLQEAVLYSDLLSKQKYFEDRDILDKGWFFNTIENIEKDTGLSAFQQRSVINVLMDLGLVSYQLKGMPAKKYFKIRTDKKALNILLGSQGIKVKKDNGATERIFNVWNETGIIHHNNIEPFKSAIEIALKRYKEQEIINAIMHYKGILQSNDYYYTYKFTLGKFLRITAKTNLIEEFLDWEIASQNYARNKKFTESKDEYNELGGK